MDTTASSIASEHISRETLVSFVRDLLGAYPNPDDPLPPGPWDPIIRAAFERAVQFGPRPDPWLDAFGPHSQPWHAAFGPQPVPWHSLFGPGPQPWVTALFRIIAQRHPELWDLVGGGPLSRVALNPQPLPPGIVFAASLADELIQRAAVAQEIADWMPHDGERRSIIIVGGRLLQYVDELCGDRFRVKFPKPVPPPWWREELGAVDLMAMGVRFENAAAQAAGEALKGALSDAGVKLIQAGLSRLR